MTLWKWSTPSYRTTSPSYPGVRKHQEAISERSISDTLCLGKLSGLLLVSLVQTSLTLHLAGCLARSASQKLLHLPALWAQTQDGQALLRCPTSLSC